MERHARAIADGTSPKVGVNVHQVAEEEDVLLREVAQRKIEPCRERIAWIQAYRAARDAQRVRDSLEALDVCARNTTANLMPAIVAAP